MRYHLFHFPRLPQGAERPLALSPGITARTRCAFSGRAPRFVLFLLFFLLLWSLLVPVILPASAFAESASVEKYWTDMTDEEKTAALSLLLDGKNGFSVPTSVYAEGRDHALNESLWFERGILAYGSSFGGTSASGPRYWGFDLNGGYYANNDFPRDSDTGKAAYLKLWLTVEQIQENAIARGYVGELALDSSAFTMAEKEATAQLWLAENPAWVSAGLDSDYILAHFCFNCVISDSGLTQGQFIGVHRSTYDGNLYYQTFGVEAPMRLFLVAEETPEPEEPIAPPPEEPTGPVAEHAEITANAQILGPDTVYVGEPFTVNDRSIFTMNGVTYLTESAYRSFGLSHDWSPSAIRATKLTEAAGTFSSAGRQTVTLTIGKNASFTKADGTPVEATVSGTLKSSKTITVLPVPAAEVSLSGPAKANRAEYMILTIHKNPSKALTKIRVTIESNGSVLYTVEKNVSSGAETVSGYQLTEPLSDSVRVTDGRVKARPMQKAASAAGTDPSLVETWELPFLTKNGTEQKYTYTVTVTDAGGKTGTATGTFTMREDKAPAASIALADAFYREAEGDQAVIDASDTTESDGDTVTRTWALASTDALGAAGGDPLTASYQTLSGAALTDLSFGAKQTVSFRKTGVGRFAVRLQAKDVWTEETFPEFITAADVLTGQATAVSEVKNLAPHVSLSLSSKQPTANFLFLADTEDHAAALEAAFPALEAELRSAGLKAALSVRTTTPTPADEATVNGLARPLTLVKSITEYEYGYEGAWTFLNSAYAIDDHRLYTVTGTFASEASGSYPTAPYTIRAYTAETGELAWTYVLTDAVMPVVRNGNFHAQNTRLVTDLNDRYLFFRSGSGQTLVLDARSGTYLTVLDTNIGGAVCSYGNQIYYYRQDGLWKLDPGTGQATQLYAGTFLLKAGQGLKVGSDTGSGSPAGIGAAGALWKGRFIGFEELSGAVYRVTFDPKTEAITRKKLTGKSGSWTVIAFDTDGKTVLHSTGLKKMLVFDTDCSQIASVGVAASPELCSAATDERGVCHYVSDGSTVHYASYFSEGPMNVYRRYQYDLASGKSTVFEAIDPDLLYPYSNNAIVSIERGTTVYEVLGCYWTYVPGFAHSGYDEKTIALIYDMTKRTVKSETTAPYGMDAIVELGARNDSWIVSRADDNKTSDAFVVTRILSEPRTKKDVEAILKARHLRRDADLNKMLPASDANAETLLGLAEAAGLLTETGDEPAAYYTLETGETVSYSVAYSDPESDPSKTQYWKYTYADPEGVQSSWTKQYSSPLTTFTVPGRYLLEHWQIDNTGTPAYDLPSNHIFLLLYVGGSAGETPEIPKSLTAGVSHTDEWEANRLAWNAKNPGDPRAENVFWAGERLVCRAAVEGDVRTVTAELKRADGTSVAPADDAKRVLTATGEANASGFPVYAGTLWSAEWINAFGRTTPEKCVVTFTATYRDGSVLTEDVVIWFDTRTSYFMIHRLW